MNPEPMASFIDFFVLGDGEEAVIEVVEMLREWHDYRRRGRMASNMRPAHAAVAEQRGSWGVGRDYFLVRTAGGRIFEIYYDRAPKNADRRKGAWFLYREMPGDREQGSGLGDRGK